MKKILTIQPLGQRDARWAGIRLGTVNGVTIGSDGCVITCQSMRMTWGGKMTTPDVLDDFLTKNSLYSSGDLWVPANASKYWPEYKYIRSVFCPNSPAPIADIKSAIDRNQPPTLWVINQGVKHNVLSVGYEDDQIIVNDPWRGDQIRVDQRWGDSATVILQVDYYEGPFQTSQSTNTNSNQPPMTTDRRPYWFDRMNTVTFNKPQENVTDADVEQFVKDYPGQKKRSGEFDKLARELGFSGDTNTMTASMLLKVAEEKYKSYDEQKIRKDERQKTITQIQRTIEQLNG